MVVACPISNEKFILLTFFIHENVSNIYMEMWFLNITICWIWLLLFASLKERNCASFTYSKIKFPIFHCHILQSCSKPTRNAPLDTFFGLLNLLSDLYSVKRHTPVAKNPRQSKKKLSCWRSRH